MIGMTAAIEFVAILIMQMMVIRVLMAIFLYSDGSNDVDICSQ